jgi:dolichol-phosphate mannosyltransferase
MRIFIDRLHGVSKINTGQYTIATLQYVFSQSPFIKYVIVGLSGVVVDFGLSYLFIERAAIAIWIATIMSSEMAIISNFLLNNFWAFSHKKISGNSGLVGSFAKFNAVAVGSIVIQAVLVQLFSNLLGKKYWYIYKALVLGFIVIPYSYFLYNKVVWKKPDRTSTTE